MKYLKHTALTLALCAMGMAAYAQDADKRIDAKAKKIMDDAVSYYQGLDSLQVDTAFNIKISSDNPALGGVNETQKLEQQFNLQRPGQFSLITQNGEAIGMGAANAYFDKGVGTVLLGDEGGIQAKDIKDIEGFFESETLGYQKEAEMNPFLDQNVAVATLKSFVLPKSDEKWDENVTGLTYVGEVELNGEKVHQMTLIAEQNVMNQKQEMAMDLWVAQGDKPLIHKVMPDMEAMLKAMAGEGNPMLKDLKMEMSGTYTNWKINEKLGDKLFAANIGDTKMYDSFMDMMKEMMGGGGPGGGDNPADALVGQPAEDFELELLGGDTFKLSEHKGEHVVILDFWATWCGPCVRALPELMAAAEDYKDKGVILIAVNQREKSSRIEKFLKKQDWKLTVALDAQGSVGDMFGVQGIPQTVIVGKDGVVKNVHVGFAPGLKDKISSELDEILAK